MNVIDQIKHLASGKWESILALPLAHTESKGQPCPLCAGKDRFHVDREFAINGAVYCRQCLDKGSGDGVGTYAWSRKIENSQAIKELASLLGIASEQNAVPKMDLIEQVCRDKRIPRTAFEQFNPAITKRGKLDVVRVPVFNPKGEPHSYFDLWPGDKGKFARGQGMSGMFFPSRMPKAGETWLMVEGVKDSAALLGLGFLACGMPSNMLSASFARLFEGVAVVLIHDLDTAGERGAIATGGVLHGIASSVRIARMQGQIKASSGEDVRDVLRRHDGESQLRSAIDQAKVWEPDPNDIPAGDRPEVLLSLTEACDRRLKGSHFRRRFGSHF